jgi:hypothetical protein
MYLKASLQHDDIEARAREELARIVCSLERRKHFDVLTP